MMLPNELFEFIFNYLSSSGVVESLIGINERLNSLVFAFIHEIDVSTLSNQWLEKYLIPIRNFITKMKFNHSQIQILFPTVTIHDKFPHLQAIVWNYECTHKNCNCACIQFLNLMKTQVLSVCLNFNYLGNRYIYKQIPSLLLNNDSLIEQLKFGDNNNDNNNYVMFFSVE